MCDEIAGHVESASRAGEVPLVLGGDHSLALGVFGGLARVHGPVGLIWFDAHADCNTPETTPSGNVHGMGLSGALGWTASSSPRATGRRRRSTRIARS